MSFSVKAVLFKQRVKAGKSPVAIRTTINRKNTYKMTGYWATDKQFEAGQFLNTYINYKVANRALGQLIAEQEKTLSLTIAQGEAISIETLKPKIQKEISVADFILKLREDYKNKFSDGILKHYNVAGHKMAEYDSAVKFSSINVEWLQGLEKYLRTAKGRYGKTATPNTLQNNMKIVKSILYKAAELGIIEKVKFENYKAPRYSQPIPEYLTETEITAIAELLPKLGESSMKTSGYYFLLSCFTGYRISDAKRFDYDKHVKDGTIVLRAKKNKSVVSIPVHDRLKDVLEFVKRNPLTIPEQNIRDYVRDVCKLAGITKHVKYHTSRHSWAMLLMNNGFSQEEVAETLGDSLNVARIYARISPERLNDKIMSKLNGAQKKPLGATQEPK